MYDVILELFGIFGLDLSPEFCENLTMSQLIPMIMIACLAFCIIGSILRCVNSIIKSFSSGFGLNR